MAKGYLVLEDGTCFEGEMATPFESCGEVVFNTSHSGYEEIVTDPSYFNQIVVFTAPQIGNYGSCREVWESERYQCRGIVCVELQRSIRDQEFWSQLNEQKLAVLTQVDTRALTLKLRDQGTIWGALVIASDAGHAKEKAANHFLAKKRWNSDWVAQVTTRERYEISGMLSNGIHIAVIDYGLKKNIVREVQKRCERVTVFPASVPFSELEKSGVQGVVLSNGPGNPEDVQGAQDTIRQMVGTYSIFAICMGHQLLSLAMGAQTYKLKFGHRGSNHPIWDPVLNKVYVAAHNHGYAVREETLPRWIEKKMINLYDRTLAGFYCERQKILSVQYHPEASPGPREATALFDFFISKMVRSSHD